MAKKLSLVVTQEGLHLPARLFSRPGEVEVIAQGDWIVVRPVASAPQPEDPRNRALAALRAAGLTVRPGWSPPPPVSEEQRAEVARRLGRGAPLSRQIIDDRADRA
jgi:hypothetical protein